MSEISSICIPSVSIRTTKYDIENVFRKLKWGEIRKIYFNYKKKYESNQIFIEFNKWNLDDPYVAEIYQRFIQGKTIKIVYDEPWFWKCSANHFQKKNFVSGEDLLIRKRQNQRLQYSKKKKIENNFDLNVK